jgi:hypothetical protein
MPLSSSVRTRLNYQHKTIEELIKDLGEAALRRNVQQGKWSAFQHIAHLAAYQLVMLARIERIQSEENPAFERYVGDDDPLFLQYQQENLKDLLTELDERRTIISSTLEGMNEERLSRTAIHQRFGILNGCGWAEFFLLHEAHHLYAIFTLTQEIRKEGPETNIK